jgi:hypothetical protein
MSVKKPYCKVCHDTGKSEYNHWVKDLNGKTTCPTLLNTECRYCFKRGHTAKFCTVLAKNNKEKNLKPQKKPLIMKKPVFQNKPTNGFAVLCNDDDEEEIANIVFGVKPEEKISWAAIAATKPTVHTNPEAKEEQKKPIQSKSWADWSDSDDDDDDENEEYQQEFGYDTW